MHAKGTYVAATHGLSGSPKPLASLPENVVPCGSKKALDGSSSSRAMRRSSSSAATPRGAASPRGTGATPPSAGGTSFRGSKDAQTPGSARGGGERPMSSGSKASGTSPPTRTSRRVSSSPAAATDLDAHSYGASPAPASAAPGAAAAATLGKKRGAGKSSALREWLEGLASEAGGFLDVLADAIAPLCGLDPNVQPGRLRTLDDVRNALTGADALAKIAGQICHTASLAAAKLDPVEIEL